MYLYLGNEGVLVGELVVDVISFQKIFGLCGLKCHIMEIWTDVTLDDTRTTDGQRNVKIGLEFWKQNSQYDDEYCLMMFCKRAFFCTHP